MKFIHIADLHLGKTVNEINLLKDQEYVLRQILEVAKSEKVDGILIAGDIYDRSIPSAEAVCLFDWFLTSVSKNGIFVCCIGGNHDSGERLDFGKHIFEKQNVFIEGRFSKKIRVVERRDAYGSIFIHLLPFFKPVQIKTFYPEEKIESFHDAMKIVLKNHPIDLKERNILITHQFVTGMEPPECSDSEQQIEVGGSEQISYQLFDMFDYTALGHLHGPQKVGKPEIRYSGSPLKYSFSEEFQKKSVVIVEMKEKGSLEIQMKLLKPLYDMRTIKGPIKELMQPEIIKEANAQDYLRIYLTDQEELLDPAAKLRTVYPNLMELILEKYRKIENAGDELLEMKEKSPMEMAESFLKLTTGETEEKRMECLKELFDEGRQEL